MASPLFSEGYQNVLKAAGMGDSWAAQPQYQTWTPSSSPTQGLQNIQSGISNNSGSVQGASTSNTGGGSSAPAPAPRNLMDPNANPGEGWWWDAANGWKQNNSVDALNNQMRDEINNGYGVAEQSFNDILNTYLPQQKQSQEAIANEQRSRGLDLLGQQQAESEGQFQRQEEKTMQGQKKSLADIADRMRNWMTAGNIKLGGMGAGDSSAQQMMNYAYGKMGNQLGGDVMSQTAGTMADLGQKKLDFERQYQTATRDVESQYNQKINEVSSWFAEQQNNLRQMQGELGVNKGRDLAAMSQNMLNQAMNAVNMAKQEAAQRRSMLDQWAMQNANTIQGLQQNLQGISNVNYAAPQANFGAVNPSLQVGAGATQGAGLPYGGGYGNTDEQKLMGL